MKLINILLMAPQGGSGRSGISSGFVSFIPILVIIVLIFLGIYLFRNRKSKHTQTNEGGIGTEKSETTPFNSLTIQRKYIIIAAAVGIVTAFLPQFKLNGINNPDGIFGFNILLRFLVFSIPIILCLRKDKTKNLIGGMFYFAIIPPGLMAIAMLLSVGGGSNEHDKEISYQFGYYLVMLAAIAVPIIGFLYKNKE